MKTCPQCQAQVVDKAKFCNKCGFNIKASEEQKSFCIECGAELPVGSLFCIECGAKTEDVSINFDNSFDFAKMEIEAQNQLSVVEEFERFCENAEVYGDTLAKYFGNSETVSIPQEITVIDRCAFDGECVKKVFIHKDVREIRENAFSSPSITNIIVDENNENYKSINGNLYTKSGDTLVRYPAGKRDSGFVIPNEVVSIEISAFLGAEHLKTVKIPDGVVSIGDNAFAYSGITSISLPDSISDIGAEAFYFCSQLKSVKLPSVLSNISPYTFYGCGALIKVDMPQELDTIEGHAFEQCTSLTEISIPNSVTKIMDEAFYYCKSLHEIELPEGLNKIGGNVFNLCEGLEKVVIGVEHIKSLYGGYFKPKFERVSIKGKGSIPEMAFYDNIYLKEVEILDGVETIGKSAFRGCFNLESVKIAESVTEIEESAFANCSRLKSVSLPNGLKVLDRYVFSGCSSIEEITLPASLEKVEYGAFSGYSKIKTINVSKGKKYNNLPYGAKIIEY